MTKNFDLIAHTRTLYIFSETYYFTVIEGTNKNYCYLEEALNNSSIKVRLDLSHTTRQGQKIDCCFELTVLYEWPLTEVLINIHSHLHAGYYISTDFGLAHPNSEET